MEISITSYLMHTIQYIAYGPQSCPFQTCIQS